MNLQSDLIKELDAIKEICDRAAAEAPPRPPYKCAACRDLGWRPVQERGCGYVFDRYSKCACRSGAERAAAVDALRVRFPRLGSLILNNYLPENPGQNAALNGCRKFIEEWPNVRRGLMFTGTAGVGKSALLFLTCCAILERGEVDAIAMTLDDLLDRIRQTYDEKADDKAPSENQIIKRLQTCELLFLDGAEMNETGEKANWARTVFYRVLAKRSERARPTLITTNACGDEFADIFGVSAYSRAREMFDIYEITGRDRRLLVA